MKLNEFNKHLVGKCWAAVRDNLVVEVVMMNTPSDINFDLYREKAKQKLSAYGELKTGSIIEHEGRLVFQKVLNHPNRGKTPRLHTYFEIVDSLVL